MFKRILLATDGSAVVERAVLYTGHLARVEQAEVIVLHAYEPPINYATYAGYDQLLDRYHTVAQTVVDEAIDELRKDGIQARGELRRGPAAAAIIATTTEYEVDLIVMGTRGHSNLEDILGSVSAQVLRYTRCPVLQIP